MLETTAALARDTQRVKVGHMVTCNGYRSPSLLAKMASTVDVLSHGRLLFGLGAGWYEHEWVAYGYPYPETRERMGAFREACEIISRMWTEDDPVSRASTTISARPSTSRRDHASRTRSSGLVAAVNR